jgi:hypothetical protein
MRAEPRGHFPIKEGLLPGSARGEAEIDAERNAEGGVSVRHLAEQRSRKYLDPEFLPHFPHKRFLGAFSFLNFSAGKFPEPSQKSSKRTAPEKHRTVGASKHPRHHGKGYGGTLFGKNGTQQHGSCLQSRAGFPEGTGVASGCSGGTQ